MNHTRSPFASGLVDLFRAMGLTQTGAARIFKVSKAAVSQWLSDRSLPRPDTLHSILEYARTHAPLRAYDEFLQLASVRAVEASVRFRGDVESVAAYLLRPLENETMAALRKLPVTEQEDMLRHLKARCEERQKRQRVIQVLDRSPKYPVREIEARLTEVARQGVSKDDIGAMSAAIWQAWEGRQARNAMQVFTACPSLQQMLGNPGAVRGCEHVLSALHSVEPVVDEPRIRVNADLR